MLMKHFTTPTAVACGVLALLAAGQARGQYSPAGRPTAAPYAKPPVMSPYLDLVRGANTPAINYFLGSRPEFQRREDSFELRQLQGDFANSQRTLGRLEEDEQRTLGPTGHATYFMNLSPFYYPATGQSAFGRGNMSQRGGASGSGSVRPPSQPR